MEEMGKQIILVTQGNGIDITVIIAAAITGLITFIIGLLVNRQGKTQFFSSIVSKERMIWIKEMRMLCTNLCTICELNKTEEELTTDEYMTFQKAKNGILLHLNSIQEEKQINDFPIDKELYDMLRDKNFAEISENITDIRDKATLIFKTEWDKVKVEAGNNWFTVRKIKKLQGKIKR